MSFEENERPRFSTTRKLEIDLQTSSPLSARGGQTTQTDTRISNKANRFKAGNFYSSKKWESLETQHTLHINEPTFWTEG